MIDRNQLSPLVRTCSLTVGAHGNRRQEDWDMHALPPGLGDLNQHAEPGL